MPMRTLPKQKLQRSPLVHVLAQLVFSSPVYGIEEHLSSIQSSLRELGFDDVKEAHGQTVVFGTDGAAERTTSEPRWDFIDVRRTWNVRLLRDVLVLQTSAYDTFDDFASRLESVIDAILPRLGVRRVQRIGLRYVDRVERTPAETFEQYVNSALLGFPREHETRMQATRVFARSDTLLQTASGNLAIRSLESRGIAVPPDLLPTPLKYASSPASDAPVLLLDFDHFRLGAVDVSGSGDVMPLFWSLHDGLDHAFRTVATDFALQQWGQELLPE